MQQNKLQIKCADTTLQNIFDALLLKNEHKVSVFELNNNEPKIAFGFDFFEDSKLLQTIAFALKNEANIGQSENMRPRDFIFEAQKNHHFYLNHSLIQIAIKSEFTVSAPFAKFEAAESPLGQLRKLLTPSLNQTAELMSACNSLNSSDKERMRMLHQSALNNRPRKANGYLFPTLKKPKFRPGTVDLNDSLTQENVAGLSQEISSDIYAGKKLEDFVTDAELYSEVDGEFYDEDDYEFDEDYDEFDEDDEDDGESRSAKNKYLFDDDDDDDDDGDDDEGEEDNYCDCKACTARRRRKAYAATLKPVQPKIYELQWDFLSVDGVSKIAEKFEELIHKIEFEIADQSKLARMHIFNFDSTFVTRKNWPIDKECLNILNNIGCDFMSVLKDAYSGRLLSADEINQAVEKMVIKAAPVLVQICRKSAASWFDLFKLYNSNVSLLKLQNLVVEYYYLIEEIFEKIENYRMSMSPGLEKINLMVTGLKSTLLVLKGNLEKFSSAKTAADQIYDSAVGRYFKDEINFNIDLDSDLITFLASELMTILKSNPVACLFTLGLLKEDNGYYSEKSKDVENQYVHICLGDTAISSAINKIVVQKDFFNEKILSQ